jgi:pseudouridine synthase, RluA family
MLIFVEYKFLGDTMKKIKVNVEDSNQRLDKFLLKFFNGASKSFIYKMLRKKNIKLNNIKSVGNEILKANDEIFIYMSDETINKFQKEVRKIKSNRPIKILYEDKNILICEKSAGILSQPAQKFDNDTLLNRLYSLYTNKINICNRLDRNTSGIIICGKNFLALQKINNLLANHLIDKYYLTIVKGKIDKAGHIENYIVKDEVLNKSQINKNGIGKKIITQYKPIAFTNDFTLLEIKLITGKSHQIRAHLQSIKHPIIGDTKYGDKDTNLFFKNKFNLHHQLLHAYKIKFNDNEFANKEIICPPPKIFSDIKNFLF